MEQTSATRSITVLRMPISMLSRKLEMQANLASCCMHLGFVVYTNVALFFQMNAVALAT